MIASGGDAGDRLPEDGGRSGGVDRYGGRALGGCAIAELAGSVQPTSECGAVVAENQTVGCTGCHGRHGLAG